MNENNEPEANESTKPAKEATCGIVMPISAIDGCPAEHWIDVQSIIKEAISSIEDPKFTARLVSDADEIGVIQKRIVQSLHDSDIVVCDVSGKNPNVMFELGLRLAFDKPTVIVKDDKTDYSFDTGVIEHILYPRDLRFKRIVDFKARLAEKVLATHKAAQNDPNHSPFLKNFGQFKVAHINKTEIPATQLILDTLSSLQQDVATLKNRIIAAPTGMIRITQLPPEQLFELIDRAISKWEAEGRTLPKILTDDLITFIRNEVNPQAMGLNGLSLISAIDQTLKQRR